MKLSPLQKARYEYQPKLPGMLRNGIEEICVKEAKLLGIPVVGLIDTNCNPDMVDVVIPGNDDAIRSVKLIANAMADAVIEAKEGEEGLAARKKAEEEALGEVAPKSEEVEASEINMEEVLKAEPVEAVKAEDEEEKKPAKKKAAKKPAKKAEEEKKEEVAEEAKAEEVKEEKPAESSAE